MGWEMHNTWKADIVNQWLHGMNLQTITVSGKRVMMTKMMNTMMMMMITEKGCDNSDGNHNWWSRTWSCSIPYYLALATCNQVTLLDVGTSICKNDMHHGLMDTPSESISEMRDSGNAKQFLEFCRFGILGHFSPIVLLIRGILFESNLVSSFHPIGRSIYLPRFKPLKFTCQIWSSPKLGMDI